MDKKSCIICGEECETPVTLPHGTIYVHSYHCLKKLNYLVNNSVPILWIGKDDLVEHNDCEPEDLKDVTPEQMIAAGDSAGDLLWDDYFGSVFEGLTERAAECLREQEGQLVRDTPKEELPLLMESLRYPESKDALTQRLKE